MRDNVIRIASYNIRKARGLDQKRVPERTLAVINGLGADIVLLQEADKRLGQRHTALPHEMITQETDYRVVAVAPNDVSLGWHGNAVLARADIAVRLRERLDLPGLEPRGAVVCEIDIGAGLQVVGTHLGLRRRDRQAQLAALREATDGAAHVVVAGDFNEWSAEKGFAPFDGRFETLAPGQSFHARRPIAALDRFALTDGLDLCDAGVDESPMARRASDHLPVWSDIRVPAATC